MANLVPSAVNSAVPQLETTTVALGGPGAPMNTQAQALLNRTAYIEALVGADSGIAPLDSGGLVPIANLPPLLSNPMTATGDMITATSGGVPAVLPVGGANEVLHGGTTPDYSAVVEGDLGLTDITTANVSTSAHGFAPKGTGVATDYLDATGAYSTPVASPGDLTGDVTSVGLATTLVNVPNATPHAGSSLLTSIAAPSTPASGHNSTYSDSTDLRFHDKNASGVVGTTVVADAGATHNFLTAVSVAGAISKSQPAFTDISGSVTTGQLPSGVALKASANVFTQQQAVTPYRANISGAVSIDLAATAMSNNLFLTLNGNVSSFALTNPVDGAVYNIKFIQDATGSRTISLPSAFKFAGGTAPTFSTAANAVDFMSAIYGSTSTTYMCAFNTGMA